LLLILIYALGKCNFLINFLSLFLGPEAEYILNHWPELIQAIREHGWHYHRTITCAS